MNLVGELVLARNQIIQFSRTSEDSTMAAASQRLNLITTELQEGVMKTRMQPIRNAWAKLPRVVRDLSNAFGKRVNVRMDGADTELDKTILEAIKDPLTHIVRNAVDHGLEMPDVRVAAGKPREGTLWLRAFHEGGQVNVEIRDDGAGINLERVKEKAIAQGLATPDQLSAMSERELTNLILLPGFSTAQKVTNVSGRGVGMDVVKTNVEKIGGTLDIHSVPGRGTTLRVKIPLTLAIVPALVITCEGDRYAIPQVSLLELVRLDGDRAPLEIELVHNEPAYRLRGRLLPLLYLDEELGLRSKRLPQEHGKASSVNIVVLQAEDRHFGLVVDQINDTQEIVVKPLGKQLKSISTYAGATIMGDGAVSLILDVNGLAARGRVLTKHRDQPLGDSHENATEESQATTSWLLVDPGDGSRVAVSLTSVDRLEEFSASQLERTGHQYVVQYRDAIMPLIPLSSSGYIDEASGSPLQVIVHSRGEQCVGIVVGRILDVVDDVVSLRREHPEDASNSRIIAGRVTTLADIPAIVNNSLPELFSCLAT
jgi:two-component system chemotaxis sensor kinase CheA